MLRPELAAVIGAERFLAEIKITANLQHPHILPLHRLGRGRRHCSSTSCRSSRASRCATGSPARSSCRSTTRCASRREVAERARLRPPARRDPSRHQAREHPAARRQRAGRRLRHRARREQRRRHPDDRDRHVARHAALHEPRAGDGRARDHGARATCTRSAACSTRCSSGEPPFTGPTAQAIIARVMTEEPRSLTLQRQTIPPHVEAAVLTALEKLPADRFATAAEFAEALAHPERTTATTRALPAYARAGPAAGDASFFAAAGDRGRLARTRGLGLAARPRRRAPAHELAVRRVRRQRSVRRRSTRPSRCRRTARTWCSRTAGRIADCGSSVAAVLDPAGIPEPTAPATRLLAGRRVDRVRRGRASQEGADDRRRDRHAGGLGRHRLRRRGVARRRDTSSTSRRRSAASSGSAPPAAGARSSCATAISRRRRHRHADGAARLPRRAVPVLLVRVSHDERARPRPPHRQDQSACWMRSCRPRICRAGACSTCDATAWRWWRRSISSAWS